MPDLFTYWGIPRPIKDDPRLFTIFNPDWNRDLRGDENTENQATVDSGRQAFYKILIKHQDKDFGFLLNQLIEYLDTLISKELYDDLDRIVTLLNKEIVENSCSLSDLYKKALYFHPVRTARRAIEYLNVSVATFDYQLALDINDGYKETYLGILIYWAEANDQASFVSSYSLGSVRQNVEFYLTQQKASEIFEKIKINPDDYAVLCDYGKTLLKLGYEEQALEYFNKALALNPFYPPAYNGRAIAYTELSDVERSREKYRKSSDIKVQAEEALCNAEKELAKVIQHGNDVDKYIKTLEEDLERGANRNLNGLSKEEYLTNAREEYLRTTNESINRMFGVVQDYCQNLRECEQACEKANERLARSDEYLALAKSYFIQEHIELKRQAFTLGLYEWRRGNNFNVKEVDPLANENFKPDTNVCPDGFFNKQSEYFAPFEQAAYGNDATHVTFSIEDETYKALEQQICLSYQRNYMLNDRVKDDAPTLEKYCDMLQEYYLKRKKGSDGDILTPSEMFLSREFKIIWDNIYKIFHGYYDEGVNYGGLLRFLDVIHLDAAVVALKYLPNIQSCLQVKSPDELAEFKKNISRELVFNPNKPPLSYELVLQVKEKAYDKFRKEIAEKISEFIFLKNEGGREYKEEYSGFSYPSLRLLNKPDNESEDDESLPVSNNFLSRLDAAVRVTVAGDEEHTMHFSAEDIARQVENILASDLDETARLILLTQLANNTGQQPIFAQMGVRAGFPYGADLMDPRVVAEWRQPFSSGLNTWFSSFTSTQTVEQTSQQFDQPPQPMVLAGSGLANMEEGATAVVMPSSALAIREEQQQARSQAYLPLYDARDGITEAPQASAPTFPHPVILPGSELANRVTLAVVTPGSELERREQAYADMMDNPDVSRVAANRRRRNG